MPITLQIIFIGRILFSTIKSGLLNINTTNSLHWMILCCGGYHAHWRMFSIYTLDTNRIPPA